MRGIIGGLVLALAATSASADTLKLANGGTLEGVVVKESEDGYVVRLKYATVTLAKDEVVSVTKKAVPSNAAPARLARWDRAVEVMAPKQWDGTPRQVPALVIDEGPLANVPYMSWRAGNYEFNLYGDPEAPAGFELGVYGPLLKDEAAKKKCIDALCELLGDEKDRALVKGLALAGGKQQREGFTFEITPETAPDAYGGWWVTAWEDAAIEKARANQEEIDRITATREEMEALAKQAKEEDAKRKADLKKAEAEARKAEAEARKAEAAAKGEPYVEPPPQQYTDSGYTDDDWVVGTYLWRNYHPGQVRPPRPTRPIAKPNPPRYYRPGYSRPAGGGGYKGGARGGGGRGGFRNR
jgi:hypothetical protein